MLFKPTIQLPNPRTLTPYFLTLNSHIGLGAPLSSLPVVSLSFNQVAGTQQTPAYMIQILRYVWMMCHAAIKRLPTKKMTEAQLSLPGERSLPRALLLSWVPPVCDLGVRSAASVGDADANRCGVAVNYFVKLHHEV